MSLTLKVNFKKGWPSPAIVEKAVAPASGVTTLEAGMVGRLDSNNNWVLGVSAVSQLPYIFRNDQADPDANRGATNTGYVQAAFGAVQGIAFSNALEIQTIQYSGTPAIGDQLYADTDGLLKVAINAAGSTIQASKPIVGVVTKGVTAYQKSNYITFVPDVSKRSS